MRLQGVKLVVAGLAAVTTVGLMGCSSSDSSSDSGTTAAAAVDTSTGGKCAASTLPNLEESTDPGAKAAVDNAKSMNLDPPPANGDAQFTKAVCDLVSLSDDQRKSSFALPAMGRAFCSSIAAQKDPNAAAAIERTTAQLKDGLKAAGKSLTDVSPASPPGASVTYQQAFDDSAAVSKAALKYQCPQFDK
ncbi:hypothetical protein [Antrihabitans cavernicola]|uniref:Uncharacterized protein n=1 Tax=Antrihabitans cavernicola TaxID=2495913 RepID=A0A5A7SG56_9NOCA|nr:hypothetical protein [Spelaeibacter cavernicola]KAA0024429.1 hypothetical protein FOY51_00200 [Spelaeibacter cavernicola]